MNSVQEQAFLAAPVNSMPTRSSSWGQKSHMFQFYVTLAGWKEHDLGIGGDFRCACL